MRCAIADGLEIPISSEHEWVIDFAPLISKMGMEKWAFGMPSSELTTFTWGHFGIVPLVPKPEQLNNGAVDWIGKKPSVVFKQVQELPEDPVLVVNHPSEGFAGYFAKVYLDDQGEPSNLDLWSENFDAIEVFNDSDFEANRKKSVRDWFKLLNAGDTFWAVGSSDSHHVRTSPVGDPRTCLYFGHDDPKQLSQGTVRDVLAKGLATISSGLFMTVEGPGGETPGSTRSGSSKATFIVTVQAADWIDATELEVIVDGKTVKTEPLAPLGGGPGKKFVNYGGCRLFDERRALVGCLSR